MKFEPASCLLPGDVLKLGPECLVEPPVEDGVGEGGRHPDEVHEGEADAAHRVALQNGPQRFIHGPQP